MTEFHNFDNCCCSIRFFLLVDHFMELRVDLESLIFSNVQMSAVRTNTIAKCPIEVYEY